MDPRISRTHELVLSHSRKLMEHGGAKAVTFSAVSTGTTISRQTLYRHWGNRENLIRITILSIQAPDALAAESDPDAFLRSALRQLRTRLATRSYQVATTQLLAAAAVDPDDAQALTGTVRRLMDSFSVGFGPITDDEYATLVGPIFVSALFLRNDIGDDALDAVIDAAIARRAAGITISED